MMSSPWTLDDGTTIYLLTPKEFAELPDGALLVDVMGESAVKGKDRIDDDTRFGYMAYGVADRETYQAEHTRDDD
jgi:hypothetical protein